MTSGEGVVTLFKDMAILNSFFLIHLNCYISHIKHVTLIDVKLPKERQFHNANYTAIKYSASFYKVVCATILKSDLQTSICNQMLIADFLFPVCISFSYCQ